MPSMSIQAPVRTGHQILLFASASLAAAGVAVEAASWVGAHGLEYAIPICGALMLAGAAALAVAERRLTGALRAAADSAARSRSQLQSAMDNMSQGLVMCDDHANVVAVNDRFLQLFGMAKTTVTPGMSVPELIRLQTQACGMPAEVADALIHERLNRPPGASGRLTMPFPSGLLEVAYQPRPGGGWACTFEDVTAQRQAQERLAFLAQHDSLTGLPNRALLHERIKQAIAAAETFAVMLVDLDHFKLANDTFGHAIGDALLCAVSGRLCEVVRDGDTVARLGGDEFAVLMIAPCARDDADRIGARLVRTLAEPFLVEGRELKIGGSVGISMANEASEVDVLLRQADTALYRVKAEGRRSHRFFAPPAARPKSGELAAETSQPAEV